MDLLSQCKRWLPDYLELDNLPRSPFAKSAKPQRDSCIPPDDHSDVLICPLQSFKLPWRGLKWFRRFFRSSRDELWSCLGLDRSSPPSQHVYTWQAWEQLLVCVDYEQLVLAEGFIELAMPRNNDMKCFSLNYQLIALMVTLSVLYLFFLSIQAQLHVIAGGWESASQNRPPFFFLESIWLFLFVDCNDETSQFFIAVENQQKAQRKAMETIQNQVKERLACFQEKVVIAMTLACMPLFLAHLLQYIYVINLYPTNCNLQVHGGECRGYFLWRNGPELQDGHIADTLQITNTHWITLNSVQVFI